MRLWIGIVVATLVLAVLAKWAARKGWIYLGLRLPRGTAAAVLGPLTDAFQPSYSYCQQEKSRHHAEVTDSAPRRPDDA